MINITEGETDSVMTGLDPVLFNINRNQAACVKSVDGSAIGKLFFLVTIPALLNSRFSLFVGGVDFMEVDAIVLINAVPMPSSIVTLPRPGIQPTRSFEVFLALNSAFFPPHRLTNAHGSVTINILDDPNSKG